MPPYKAWTISPLNPYGAYKPEEYQAEVAAGRAHVERMRAEAESERLAAAQRLNEQKYAFAEEAQRRGWAREMPMEMLDRKWEGELGAKEAQILDYEERRRLAEEKQDFEERKYGETQRKNKEEALQRIEAANQKERDKPRFAPDYLKVAKYMEEGGKLPDPSLGWFLSALGKQDAAREAFAPSRMPRVREAALGRREEDDIRNYKKMQFEDATRLPPKVVNEIQNMEIESKRREHDYAKKEGPVKTKELRLRGKMVEAGLKGGDSREEKFAYINKLAKMFSPHTRKIIDLAGEELTYIDWSGDLLGQIRRALKAGFSQLENQLKKQFTAFSPNMGLAIRMSALQTLGGPNSIQQMFSFDRSSGSEELKKARFGMFARTMKTAIKDLSFK